jgi:hypothetical protein
MSPTNSWRMRICFCVLQRRRRLVLLRAQRARRRRRGRSRLTVSLVASLALLSPLTVGLGLGLSTPRRLCGKVYLHKLPARRAAADCVHSGRARFVLCICFCVWQRRRRLVLKGAQMACRCYRGRSRLTVRLVATSALLSLLTAGLWLGLSLCC